MKNLLIIFMWLPIVLLVACTANMEEIAILAPTPLSIELPDIELTAVKESTEPPFPTATHAQTNESPLPPTATPTPLMGTLLISSQPPGAEITIANTEIADKPPHIINLAPGYYIVTLSLNGYQTHQETILILEGETSEIERRLTPNPMNVGQYITLTELDGVGAIEDLLFLAYATWDSEQHAFIYAINKGVNLAESKDWFWWQYDMLNQQTQQLAPPESVLNDEIRQQLNLCPLNEFEWEGPRRCSYLTSLLESREHGLIVYSPLLLEDFPYNEGQLWLAQVDGSTAQKLADFAPAYVNWSSDGRWLVTGYAFAGLPGQVIHYLVATDGSVFEDLQSLTGADNFYLNGMFPEFNPNGRELLYAGSQIAGSREASDYKLYSLSLDDFESRLVTDKFGLFQWAENGEGIYVLDGAFFPLNLSDHLHTLETNLYYVDIAQNDPWEYVIADHIPYYPFSNYGTWNWAYSPTHHAIVYVGFKEHNELGVLQLEPSTSIGHNK